MPNDIPENFARRARLSSTAIVTAVSLTLAAAVALLIGEREPTSATVEPAGQVSRPNSGGLPDVSVLVPVVARQIRN